jgi:hypothetical protein
MEMTTTATTKSTEALRPPAACRDAFAEWGVDTEEADDLTLQGGAIRPTQSEAVAQRHAAAYRDTYAEWDEDKEGVDDSAPLTTPASMVPSAVR